MSWPKRCRFSKILRQNKAGLIYFAELKILHTFAVPKGEVLLRREISKFIFVKYKENE